MLKVSNNVANKKEESKTPTDDHKTVSPSEGSGLKFSFGLKKPSLEKPKESYESTLKLSSTLKAASSIETDAEDISSEPCDKSFESDVVAEDILADPAEEVSLVQGVEIPEGMEGDANFAQYAKYREKQLSLAKIVNDATGIASVLNMGPFTQKLRTLSDKINNDSFKVQIVGTFKNGKSTFINSFLGEEVLPAYALPCTAVINEVKYGSSKRAVLHFKNPLPETIPKELSKRALEHMEKYSMKDIPPMEIPYDEIEDYVVIPMDVDPRDMLLESPYEKVELYWPLDILKNGIEIIDSPGLNEHATRTKVTMDYISKADAVIFVLSATTLCSLDEMTFIEENLRSYGFEDLFFVVNRFDLIPEKERRRIKQYALTRLSPFTSFGEEGVFFLSARDALDAKISSDADKLSLSGMPGFEDALSDFLTNRRGKLKLLTPARELRRVMKDDILGKVILRSKEMHESTAEELKERYDKIKPRLNDLETKKTQLYDKMLIKTEECKADFRVMVRRNVNNIIDSTPVWVNEYVPTVKLGLFPSKDKLRTVINGMSTYISGKLEQSNLAWRTDVLIPAIDKKAADIFESASMEAKALMVEVSHAVDMAIGKKLVDTDLVKENDVSYGFNSLYSLKQGDLQLTKVLAMHTAGTALTRMISVIPGASLFTSKFALGQSGSESLAVKQLKEAMIREVTNRMYATAEEAVESITDIVAKAFTENADLMIAPITDEITETQSQIERAIAELELGENSLNEKKDNLRKCESDARDICSVLDDFIDEVIF